MFGPRRRVSGRTCIRKNLIAKWSSCLPQPAVYSAFTTRMTASQLCRQGYGQVCSQRRTKQPRLPPCTARTIPTENTSSSFLTRDPAERRPARQLLPLSCAIGRPAILRARSHVSACMQQTLPTQVLLSPPPLLLLHRLQRDFLHRARDTDNAAG